ncbi:MAG: hypothetical protein HY913_08800 [Desulfomonile tiedjei]|nr:hypothetical protein [Desulfomonile tiedjei]
MRAEYRENGTIEVSGTSRKEGFNRIWAGIGWPDQDTGYICIVGERLEGRYHCLWEKRGGLWELGDAALEARDRFLVDVIWVDARDDLATAYLRTLDGLCFYENPFENSSSFQPSSNPSSSDRSLFRGRDTTATVMAVPDKTLSNYRSALEKTRGLILAGRLLIHEANCPILGYTLRQPLDELLKSPVMKALVWVLTALEDAKGNGLLEPIDSDPWYANIPRSDK